MLSFVFVVVTLVMSVVHASPCPAVDNSAAAPEQRPIDRVDSGVTKFSDPTPTVAQLFPSADTIMPIQIRGFDCDEHGWHDDADECKNHHEKKKPTTTKKPCSPTRKTRSVRSSRSHRPTSARRSPCPTQKNKHKPVYGDEWKRDGGSLHTSRPQKKKSQRA